MWKIRAGMVPNFGVRFKENLRLGSIIEVPTNTTGMARYKTLREDFIAIEGAKVFNCIPRDIREIRTYLERFKKYLDIFLDDIPDQPAGANYTPEPMDQRCKHSNSIRDWIPHLGLSSWSHPNLKNLHIEEKEEDEMMNVTKDASGHPGTTLVDGNRTPESGHPGTYTG